MSDPARAHLLETWQTCQQAAAWLRRSFDKSPLPPYVEVNENDWDQLEALSGRFARLTDLIVHKLLRALDRYEFEETGALLDAANRAVKRGLIESIFNTQIMIMVMLFIIFSFINFMFFHNYFSKIKQVFSIKKTSLLTDSLI